MTTNWKLFIDDERDASRLYPNMPDLVVARTYAMAENLIKFHGIPNFVAFDHDLGDPFNRTGYDLAKLMVDLDLDGVSKFPDDFSFNVHSANPVGAANIQNYLDAYLKQR